MHDPLNENDVRQWASLEQTVETLKLTEHIYQTYLRVGTGNFKPNAFGRLSSVDPCVWPTAVTSALASTVNDGHESTACEQYVRQRLQFMADQMQQHQHELNETKHRIGDDLSVLGGLIRAFVHANGVARAKMQSDLTLTLLEHEYDTEIVRRQCLHEHPTEEQVRFRSCCPPHLFIDESVSFSFKH